MVDRAVIAIDAMGGDAGPDMVVPGIVRACERQPDAKFILFGDQTRLEQLCAGHKVLRERIEIRHSEKDIGMNDKPSQALRQGRGVSAMWQAVDAVKTGLADVAVSAGNTGALMAMAKIILKTMPGIERPAIAAIWPTVRGESIVLDVGATIGGGAEQLIDNAIMGEAMARCLFGLERPSVGLLNVGVEDIKGVEEVRAAGRMLRASGLPIEYAGFVEGDDIGNGTVDVIVCEGFTGNIALKVAEGTAKQLAIYLRKAMSRSWMSKIGYLFARGAFSALKDRVDPRNNNGGVFLGLNGIVVKSHGGTDDLGFASAVDLAIDMVHSRLVDKIAADLAEKQDLLDNPHDVADVAEAKSA